MRPHEKLDVWKKSIDFVVAVYKSTEAFPNEEKFGLTVSCAEQQYRSPPILRKAQVENHTESLRTSCRIPRDQSEVDTELLIAHRLSLLGRNDYGRLRPSLDEIGRMLTGLTRHVQQRG